VPAPRLAWPGGTAVAGTGAPAVDQPGACGHGVRGEAAAVARSAGGVGCIASRLAMPARQCGRASVAERNPGLGRYTLPFGDVIAHDLAEFFGGAGDNRTADRCECCHHRRILERLD